MKTDYRQIVLLPIQIFKAAFVTLKYCFIEAGSLAVSYKPYLIYKQGKS